MSTIPSITAFKSRIRTRHLLLLRKLGDCGVLRQAAEELNMTQPTATQLLQQIEQSLGVSLFVRHSRGMTPTIYGEVLIRYAGSIDNDLTSARDELQGLSEGSSGKVAIGTVSGAVPSLVSPAIAQLKDRAPSVRVSVHVESSSALLPVLAQGALDLVIGRVVEGFSVEDFALEPLSEEPMCIVSGVHHPLAARHDLKLSELMGETWILQPRGSAIRTPVERALREKNFTELPQILEATSILLTTALLQETSMISVVPLDVARHYSQSAMIKILPVDFVVNMERQALITRRGIELSPAVKLFVDALHRVRSTRAKQSYS